MDFQDNEVIAVKRRRFDGIWRKLDHDSFLSEGVFRKDQLIEDNVPKLYCRTPSFHL